MTSESICADLGRCAYAVADEQYGDGATEDGCEFWSDCFGTVVIGQGQGGDERSADGHK